MLPPDYFSAMQGNLQAGDWRTKESHSFTLRGISFTSSHEAVPGFVVGGPHDLDHHLQKLESNDTVVAKLVLPSQVTVITEKLSLHTCNNSLAVWQFKLPENLSPDDIAAVDLVTSLDAAAGGACHGSLLVTLLNVTMSDTGSSPLSTLLLQKVVNYSDAGQIRVDVTPLAKHWAAEPELNRGLYIRTAGATSDGSPLCAMCLPRDFTGQALAAELVMDLVLVPLGRKRRRDPLQPEAHVYAKRERMMQSPPCRAHRVAVSPHDLGTEADKVISPLSYTTLRCLMPCSVHWLPPYMRSAAVISDCIPLHVGDLRVIFSKRNGGYEIGAVRGAIVKSCSCAPYRYVNFSAHRGNISLSSTGMPLL